MGDTIELTEPERRLRVAFVSLAFVLLSAIILSLVYLSTIPVSFMSYRRLERLRGEPPVETLSEPRDTSVQ